MKPLMHALMLGAALTMACSDDSALQPNPDAGVTPGPTQDHAGGASQLRVISRNLYVGADVDAVIAALATPDPSDDIPALTAAIQTLHATDFPTRAGAIADEIAANSPDVVGLQEVFTLNLDLTALGLPVVINLPFLDVLMQQLDARGLHYTVATHLTTTQASPLPGISLTDADAILVNADRVQVGSTFAKIFDYNIGAVAPGVTILRGWTTAQVTVEDRTYTVVNTHPESGEAPGLDQLRAAQAQEIALGLGTASPVVLTGDLNDVPGSLMYQVMAGPGSPTYGPASVPGRLG